MTVKTSIGSISGSKDVLRAVFQSVAHSDDFYVDEVDRLF